MKKKERNALLDKSRKRKKKIAKRQYDDTPYLSVREFLDDDKDDGIYEDAIFNGCGHQKCFFVVESDNGPRKVSGLKSVAKGFDDDDDDTYSLVLEILPKDANYNIDLLVVSYADPS